MKGLRAAWLNYFQRSRVGVESVKRFELSSGLDTFYTHMRSYIRADIHTYILINNCQPEKSSRLYSDHFNYLTGFRKALGRNAIFNGESYH